MRVKIDISCFRMKFKACFVFSMYVAGFFFEYEKEDSLVLL